MLVEIGTFHKCKTANKKTTQKSNITTRCTALIVYYETHKEMVKTKAKCQIQNRSPFVP
jgi:hypothetical protein